MPDNPDNLEEERDRVTKRLAGIAGHAASVKRMWEENRECGEILIQIAAVRAALDQAGKLVLQHHLSHCVEDAVESGDAKRAIAELKAALDHFV